MPEDPKNTEPTSPEDDGATLRADEGRSERDWPWLFSGWFWKVVAGLALVLVLGISVRTWVVETAKPDPTQVVMVTQPRVEPGETTPVRVFVRDTYHREPVAEAQVQLVMVGDQGSRRLGSAQTNEDGIADFSADMADDLAVGDYTLRVEARGKSGKAETEQTVRVQRAYRTMLSTDKPLYQPGQIIHMRALSMETDSLKPAAGREVAFAVRDAKGNKVFGKTEQTSDFGIAAADFKLANQVNEGSYTIAVTLGDATSEREVKVETYVLPKFRVQLTADRGYYAPGEVVNLELDVNYTFGQPVAEGEVTIRADEFVERFRTFDTFSGRTNADGKLAARIPLKSAFVGQPLNQGNAFVRFVAEVIDATGETQTKSVEVKVTNEPLRIEVFPESGELVQNVENTLYIVTAYPDGAPAKSIVYTGGGSRVETNALGIGQVKLTPNQPNLKLSLSARSDRGAEAKVTKELAVGERADGILLRTDRAVYRQGQTAELTVLSASRAKRVFLDIVKNGRSFATSTIALEKGQGSYAYDLPLDLAGTVQLQAYAILDDGEIARDTKLIQVHRADALTIEARLDAETYQPAEKAMIEFLVTGKDGNPVEAALSLAAVDEAVFALSDSRPGLEEMVFLIQEEILKPRAQFVAHPPADFTRAPMTEPEPELVEANVIALSTVKDEVGPASSQGATEHQRREAIEATRREHRRGLVRLLAQVPFTGFLVSSLVFLGYAFSRLRFQPRESDPLHVTEFQRRMRQLCWILVAVTLAAPMLLVLLVGLGVSSEFVIVFFWVVITIAGTVWLGIKTAEIRRLTHTTRHLALFHRLLPLVPVAYGLAAMTVLGCLLAEWWNYQALEENEVLVMLLSALFVLALVSSLIGFLRRSLSEILAPLQKGFSLAKNLVLVLSPVVLLLVAPLFITANHRMGDVQMVAEMAMERAGGIEPSAPSSAATGAEPPRVRRFFPETLLWQPQLLTNADGQAQLEVTLADSITTWRLSGSAVSRDGNLGSFQRGIRVFQDFFIDIDFPAELTQNDEITVPIAIFNYLDEPQTIQLAAGQEDWFEFVDDVPDQSIEADAGGVMQASYRIRALQPGRHALTVSARGTRLADAVERTVRVIPDGERIETVVNGRLEETAREIVRIPENAIPGGSDWFVKIYPGAFSQVVEGMDSIFRMPYGCFEQTSSTTYPNVLVLNYLRETEQVKPELELKALDFIAQGYQRLLSYEVDGGGFEWFGNSPAHNVLTAYGLLQFGDMAKVYEVDQAVIDRTRQWLLNQQETNGTWIPSDGGIAEGAINEFQGASEAAILRTTAYITWAIAESGGGDRLERSFDVLASASDGVDDPYTLALIANAFVAAQRSREAQAILRQLDQLKSEEGEACFWEAQGSGLTHGRGLAFTIETTALVAQAMLRENRVSTAHQALAWLISQRDEGGTWHSTQATVQAMRALLMGAGSQGVITQPLSVQIAANGAATNPLSITRENADVFHLVSLTEFVQPGENDLTLTVDGEANLAYQMVTVHYQPRSEPGDEPPKILEIETDYRTTQLATDDLLTVAVTLRYHRPGSAPMTLVDLGIPPGFDVEPSTLRKLVEDGVIQRFEPKGRQVTLYFDTIPGDGQSLTFTYSLRARFPVKAQAPAAVAYQYYEPEVRDESLPVMLQID